MFEQILKNPLYRILLLGGIVFAVTGLIALILFIRQERINRELRLRISDLEWLQMSHYHKNKTSSNIKHSSINVEKSKDLSGNDLKKELEELENDMSEMEKILEENDDDDDITQMIFQMVKKHEDNTVLDENLINVINTPSVSVIENQNDLEDESPDDNSNDSLHNYEISTNSNCDIKEIEEKLMSSINDGVRDESSDVESNNVQEVDDIEWISDSYTLSELKDLCKKFNISNKGNKKEIIKRLLDNNMEIPKKSIESTTSL
jgi:hypothetical protein